MPVIVPEKLGAMSRALTKAAENTKPIAPYITLISITMKDVFLCTTKEIVKKQAAIISAPVKRKRKWESYIGVKMMLKKDCFNSLKMQKTCRPT